MSVLKDTFTIHRKDVLRLKVFTQIHLDPLNSLFELKDCSSLKLYIFTLWFLFFINYCRLIQIRANNSVNF